MKIKFTQEGKVPMTSGGVGLFFEDLNYDLDGGLYAEMLENRNFEAKDVHGEWDHYIVEEDGGYGWEPYPKNAHLSLKIKTDRALFPENPHYLRIETEEDGAGVSNKAYDGIYLTKGNSYKISFYARSYDYRGAVRVGVFGAEVMLMGRRVKLITDGKWHKYSFTVKAKEDAERAQFRFLLEKAGTIHVDAFSMMPQNAVLGVFRRDLVELMKAMNPGFLRFPGGCVVEGNDLKNRYLWKNSVGPVERRKQNWNRWAVHATGPETGWRSAYSHYGQTLGVGYYEYFRLAEYLGAKPLPVVSVGIACQYMSTEFVPVDDPELETYIQEALDVVEFANGGTDTVWGKVRAEMGHPEPFNLEMLGVGNEQWEASPVQKDTGKPAPNEFYRRFELFEKRIHEKYPDLKIVGTVGPTVDTDSHRDAWKWTRENLQKNPNFVYVSDEHFYVPPQWLYDHVDVYDSYPRLGTVYAGEYAAHVPGSGAAGFNAPQSNCWEGALAEAAFMTGMERNSDVVIMKSFAPLFGRLGYTEWCPNMIWFDGKSAYGSASYYVQLLYSQYTGDWAFQTTADEKGIYASVTERDGTYFVKAVNANDTEAEAEIEGDVDFGALTRIIRLEGKLEQYNTIERPTLISPEEIAPTAPASLTLPPHSFTVMIFKK